MCRSHRKEGNSIMPTKKETVKKETEKKSVKAAVKSVAKAAAKAVPARKAAPAKKETVKAAPAKKEAVKAAPAKKALSAKKAAKQPEVIIQSPLGGIITPEEILQRIGQVDKVYIRVDQNKAHWVRGDEIGSIDLW